MTPEQLAEIVAFTPRIASSDAPFDVVDRGPDRRARSRPAELELAERYREAGLTWWIEKLGWFRGPLAAMRARIEAGPPRP